MLSYRVTNTSRSSFSGLIFCFIVSFFFVFANLADQDDSRSNAYASNYSDSMLSWESNERSVPDGFVSWLLHSLSWFADCAERTMILSRSELNNVCIPQEIGDEVEGDECAKYEASTTAWDVVRNILSIAVVVGIVIAGIALGLATSWLGIGIIILAVIGVQVIATANACNNLYILAPHEYINWKEGKMECKIAGKEVINDYVPKNTDDAQALTQLDVPFFYNCERGKYGYLSDVACANKDILKYAEAYGGKEGKEGKVGKVGSIFVVGKKLSGSSTEICQKRPGFKATEITVEQTRNAQRVEVEAKGVLWGNTTYTIATYYRFHGGKVQLCAYTTNTLSPMRVGCTYVPPPIERFRPNNDDVVNYIANTRCSYFATNRLDLKALGLDLSKKYTHNSVVMFLSSDMHFTSTVVGCLEDLLSQIMVYGVGAQKENFIHKVQTGLKRIVLLVLAIYVIMSAIKLLSAAQVPQKSEWIMMLIRFALVLFFTTSNIWYGDPNSKDASDDSLSKNGLYSMIIKAVPALIDVFMQSTNETDPFAMCNLKYPGADGGNLLSERLIPGVVSPFSGEGGQTNTVGYTKMPGNEGKKQIKLTAWDYLDCKIANYLNLGNCNYSITGMLTFLFIPLSIFMGVKGFIFGIASAIYLILIMLIVFRFVHITILSLFIITVLILVAPLIICFSLFEYTKQTFSTWMRMLLGYIIYPGMLFAFLSLMIVTFDTLFYGDDKAIAPLAKECASNVEGCRINYDDLCPETNADNPSVYCAVFKQQIKEHGATDKETKIKRCNALGNGSDGFTASLSSITSAGTYILYKIIGSDTVMNDKAMEGMFSSMLKLALFALMFYLFLNYVMELIGAITQAYDAAGISKGSINIAGIMGRAPAAAASFGGSAIKSGIKSAYGKITGAAGVQRGGGGGAGGAAGGGQGAP